MVPLLDSSLFFDVVVFTFPFSTVAQFSAEVVVSAIFSPFYAVTSMEFPSPASFVLQEFLLLSSVLTIHPVRTDLSFFFCLRTAPAVFLPAAFHSPGSVPDSFRIHEKQRLLLRRQL